MGDGLVAGNPQTTVNAAGGGDGYGGRRRHVRRSYVSRLRDASAAMAASRRFGGPGAVSSTSASYGTRDPTWLSGSSSPARSKCSISSQVVSDHMGRTLGLDEDALHWVGVAIRESVINAIKHGNRNDAGKHVFVEFSTEGPADAVELHDPGPRQGQGFDPSTVADPLAPENLLKSSGRGIFLIRSFMDDVQLRNAPEGGMEIRMIKRAEVQGLSAILSVVSRHRHRGGRPCRQTADGAVRRRSPDRQEGHDRSRHRGRRCRRAHVPCADRRSVFPIIRCWPKRWAAAPRRRPARAGCSIRSTARPTTRTACRFSAPRSRSRSTASRKWRPCSIRTARNCSPPSVAAARF